MPREEVTILGPGARLAALARCVRGADGAPPVALSDLLDLLAVAHDTNAPLRLVLDLDATPAEDLGILRRLRQAYPRLRVLWTAAPSSAGRLAALADDDDPFRPWPLDVTWLLGSGAAREGAGAIRSASALDDARPGPSAPEAPRSAPRDVRDPPPTAAPSGAQRGAPPPPRADPDLARIEAILAGLDPAAFGFDAGPGAPEPAATAAMPPRGTVPGPTASGPERAVPGAAATSARPSPRGAEPRRPAVEPELLVEEPFPAGEDDYPLDLEDDPFGVESDELAAASETDLAPSSARDAAERDASPSADAPPAARRGAHLAPPRAPAQLPPWYRDQVADLADLVQRADLALLRAEDGGTLAAARMELARLRQFARTLGFLAAPPAKGRTRLDLGVFVEETIASLVAAPPHAAPPGSRMPHAEGEHDASPAGAPAARREERPRFFLRAEAGLEVVADKALLATALDAVLQVAAAASLGSAEQGKVVRTEVVRVGGTIEVSIDFAAGALAGVEPSRVLEPYGVRARLEGIGANALAAAGGILVGQGGDLELTRRADGRLCFSVRLPAA